MNNGHYVLAGLAAMHGKRRTETPQYTGWCLDKEDLCVAKLCAFREKDRNFVAALVRSALVDRKTILTRLSTVDERYGTAAEVAASWLRSLSTGSEPGQSAGTIGNERILIRPRAMVTTAPASRSCATAGRFAASRAACSSVVSRSADRRRTTEGRVAPRLAASSSPKSLSAETITSALAAA